MNKPIITIPVSGTDKAKNRLLQFDRKAPLYRVFGITSRKQFLSIPLENLDLSSRAEHCLSASNIYTLHSVLSLSIQDLLRLPKIGISTADEIVSLCRQYCMDHMAKQTAGSPETGTAEKGDDSSICFLQLMIEFKKLNPAGRDIAVETLKGLTALERFRA